MLVIIFLICAVSGVASYARGRGGNPWLWGTAAAVGFVLIPLLSGLIYRSPGNSFQGDGVLWSYLGAFGWMGIVALGARFLLGRSREKPSGMWSCPNCKYLNQQYAVICEACKQPYRSKALPLS